MYDMEKNQNFEREKKKKKKKNGRPPPKCKIEEIFFGGRGGWGICYFLPEVSRGQNVLVTRFQSYLRGWRQPQLLKEDPHFSMIS